MAGGHNAVAGDDHGACVRTILGRHAGNQQDHGEHYSQREKHPTPSHERVVKLRILRSNSRPLTLTVKRGSFRAPAAEARMEAGRIGILKINSFDNGEAADVRTRLQELIKQGAQKIVLDLRSVAGGEIQEGVSVTNLFIRDGVIAEKIGREQKVLQTFEADPKAELFAGPVVALIDGGTAGAAEIVASAFLERKRGDLVGEKSFGAGAEHFSDVAALLPAIRGRTVLVKGSRFMKMERVVAALTGARTEGAH